MLKAISHGLSTNNIGVGYLADRDVAAGHVNTKHTIALPTIKIHHRKMRLVSKKTRPSTFGKATTAIPLPHVINGIDASGRWRWYQ
jgi:hypothetical protein